MESKSVTLPSDDEGGEGCMPKIINTISLQGCSELSFSEEPDNGYLQNVLYPECEIKEEDTRNEEIKTEPVENGLLYCSKDKKEVKNEKKRLTLTHLPSIKKEKEPKMRASTSRRDDVVDVKRIALQESLFKTKELFDTFLRVCQDHENSEQMEQVVEKLVRVYATTKQEFLGSPAFQNMLEAETEKVNTSDIKPWRNLKLVMDELKHNKKNMGSKLKLGESEESQDAGASNDDEPVIECPKKRRHLKKLEKVLRAINLKIKKLEEREVDWEDEDDSAYCKLDRYRAQFTKIYTKICEIKGKLADADRPYLRKVSFAGTTYPHINRCIEKYYNKHREFPDFQDIKKLVILALKQEGIEMPPIKIHSMAASAFKEFGEMLKRLRQYDDYDVLISYLDQQVDPAHNDEQLQEQLNKNALLFKKREQEVIDKFVEKESARDIGSESEDSDSKPKKKRKIIIANTSSKKKPVSDKKTLSSSEGSADENELSKPNPGLALSSDSVNSDSDSVSEEKVKKQSVKGKGKALIGKQKLVKKGVKKSSPNKSQMPKTAISSDEESAPRNTKESLTNYLGLKGKSSPKSTATKESNKTSESKDETADINEHQRPGTRGQRRSVSSDSSESKRARKTNTRVLSERNVKSDSHSSENDKEPQVKFNTIADSDSDVEPIAVINQPKQNTGASARKPSNRARKKIGPVTRQIGPKKPVNTADKTHETISDSSDCESRTSDEESESEKKSLSGVELSPEVERINDYDPDVDEPIVILSEDVIEEPKPAASKQNSSRLQEGSSDSDDICILSQVQTERRTVAPRKMRSNNTTVTPISAQRKAGIATSTPIKISKVPLKRRLSNQTSDGNGSKTRKVNVTTNGNGKETTLPQIINGASRKVLTTRFAKPKSSSGSSSPEIIPLIEID